MKDDRDFPSEEEVTDALYRLLVKFHIETDCGKKVHWAECEGAFEVLEGLDPEQAEEFKDAIGPGRHKELL